MATLLLTGPPAHSRGAPQPSSTSPAGDIPHASAQRARARLHPLWEAAQLPKGGCASRARPGKLTTEHRVPPDISTQQPLHIFGLNSGHLVLCFPLHFSSSSKRWKPRESSCLIAFDAATLTLDLHFWHFRHDSNINT